MDWGLRTGTCQGSSRSARHWPTAVCLTGVRRSYPPASRGPRSAMRVCLPIGARVRYIENERTSRDLQRLQLDLLADLNREHLAVSDRTSIWKDASTPSNWPSNAVRHAGNSVRRGRASATLKAYGLDDPVTANFGRQCPLARRFAERGVRFVQVTHSDSYVRWDQHSKLKEGHEKNA